MEYRSRRENEEVLSEQGIFLLEGFGGGGGGGGGQLFLGKPLHRRTTGWSPGTVTPIHGVYLRPHHRYTLRTGLETGYCVWALVNCAVCILLTWLTKK